MPKKNPRRVSLKKYKYSNTTIKEVYPVPLAEGIRLGDIAEPDVEGKVFKADNGKVTVYGRLTGSEIKPADGGMLERLAEGTLLTGRDEAAAAAEPALPESDEGEEADPQGGEDE